MANPNPSSSEPGEIPVNSYETALCIVPPQSLWPRVDRLRALYDKAYEKWPPHVNLIYPFARLESLEKAAGEIQSALAAWRQEAEADSLELCLDAADVFPHKHDNTIFIHDSSKDRTAALQQLRRAVLEALGHRDTEFRMHMTVGQSDDVNRSPHKFLLHKVGLLPDVAWTVDRLSILVRERLQLGGSPASRMKLWGTISLADGSLSRCDAPSTFYELSGLPPADSEESTDYEVDEPQSSFAYASDPDARLWERCLLESGAEPPTSPRELAVASYNVLAEFRWPISQARYPLIIRNILSPEATADVLVLQEVTDDFLCYLLRDENIRQAYPYVSHGPPDQPDIEPLPNLLNLVVLSRWAFDWGWVSFKRKHKGSVVAKFRDIGKWEDAEFLPLVLATVHLTHGLTDGSISNKKNELQRTLNYLQDAYPDHPWVLAGDFNIATSSFTVEAALRKNAITAQTADYLAGMENMFTAAGLIDAWSYCRRELGDDSHADPTHDHGETFEGEQGATHDPTTNALASKIVGSGLNNRPQRYDRIFVCGRDLLGILQFNAFGFPIAAAGGQTEQPDPHTLCASDHWGVRCTMRVGSEVAEEPAAEVISLVVPVTLERAPPALANVQDLHDTLAHLGAFPTEGETNDRAAAFELLKSIVAETAPGEEGGVESTGLARLKSSLVVVPVGSYGLGVWTSTSDVDCLCIGPFSSSTFFALTVQRLKKAAAQGVKILRRVRANSGTMLELEVQGIKMDLQYCPAAAIAEKWPAALQLPASDPAFSLPAQTLAKLKAIRDLDYLRRSIPDLPKFRLAFRFIKTWAKSRGIYAAKFGYLGGIQIAILLSRVGKLLARQDAAVSVPDILRSFFHHYAAFDWKHDIAFDPFFHKQRVQYTRTPREPLAILGFHPPTLNTSLAASTPSVRTIAEELRRAEQTLSSDGATWSQLLGRPDAPWPELVMASGAADFLRAYKSYVKIDVQFWGLSLAKGAAFVGWLESRCVAVLVDIHRRLPTIHARIWPARFVDAASAEEDRDYQGYYLIGLDRLDGAMSKEDLAVASGALLTVLRRFEEQIRGDDKYFDGRSEWMSAGVATQAELGELCVDRRAWGEYRPGDDESDEEEESSDEGDESAREGESGEDGLGKSKKGKSKGKSKQQQQQPPSLGPGKKFRTAQDVIARLRWDPSLDSSDYMVGYEDRFVGAREKPLDAWKSELTDDEFIPQHRVLYFKRRSDGAVVWERRTRRDDVFGSGV